jgi:NAD(P)-dependent dehydrogenase (short-subunit alcohol dehydrogenase family)
MPIQPFSLENRLAVITGGGTGIGLAIAEAFVTSGARVIITGRREEVLKTACGALGANASYRVCDLADGGFLPTLVAAIEAESGPIDILVNNAGINLKKPTIEVTDEEFARIQQTNLHGLFSLTREVVRHMTPRKRGVILNITSMAAMYGLPRVAAYTASKSAVLGLTRELAVELGPIGIRVNAIAPGFIFSEMTAKALDADPERKARVLARTPLGRMGNAEEVAWGAVYLCSDAASFVTGVNLCVDGGNSIGF